MRTASYAIQKAEKRLDKAQASLLSVHTDWKTYQERITAQMKQSQTGYMAEVSRLQEEILLAETALGKAKEQATQATQALVANAVTENVGTTPPPLPNGDFAVGLLFGVAPPTSAANQSTENLEDEDMDDAAQTNWCQQQQLDAEQQVLQMLNAYLLQQKAPGSPLDGLSESEEDVEPATKTEVAMEVKSKLQAVKDSPLAVAEVKKQTGKQQVQRTTMQAFSSRASASGAGTPKEMAAQVEPAMT